MNLVLSQYLVKVFVILALALCMTSCSKEEHIAVKENIHLEETPAGFWLRMFGIDYSPSSGTLKQQISEKLRLSGKLENEYVDEKGPNKVKTYVWEYQGHKIKEEYYRGGVWKGPKVFPGQEYYNRGLDTWITIEFRNSIPYSRLLPNDYSKINQSRQYEHTATIESTADQGRRLFLFGYGTRCKRISLF